MPSEIIPRQRVSVQQDLYCFVVLVDAQPVLRCPARREALRYAVLVRRALQRADFMAKRSSDPSAVRARKILN